MAAVTDIGTARRRRVFDHALLRQRVRIRASQPCLYRPYHLPYYSVCIFCWPLQPDPYSGKEGIVLEWEWDPRRGKGVFEIQFDDGVTRQYLNGDFDLAGERIIAHN